MTYTKKILVDFAFWSSSAGMPHVGRAKSKCMGSFWLLIWFVCLACFIYQVWMIIVQYLSYQVLVQTKLIFKPMSFPSVTVCNLNPYKASRIGKYAELKELMSMYIESTKETLDRSRDIYDLLRYNDSMERLERARDAMEYLAGGYPQTSLDDLTYRVEDLIGSCSFSQVPCGPQNFTPVYDPIYGRCFKFNTSMTSERAGPKYGLRLFLITDVSEYIDTSDSLGVRVTITRDNDPIFPDSFGHNAQTGFTTSFALKYLQTTRLPYPYSNCTQAEPGQSYSSESCFRNCLQHHVAEVCGCQDPHSAFVPSLGKPTCDYTKMDCVTAASTANDTSFDAKACYCPPLCQEGTYEVAATTSNWPSQSYKKMLCTDRPESDCQYYSDNTMFLELYYEALNYQELTESEAYPLEIMISDIGGDIGLWLGVSVISIVEFVFLPFLLTSSLCQKRVAPQDMGRKLTERGEMVNNEFDRIGGSRTEPLADGEPMKNISNTTVDPYTSRAYTPPPRIVQ